MDRLDKRDPYEMSPEQEMKLRDANRDLHQLARRAGDYVSGCIFLTIDEQKAMMPLSEEELEIRLAEKFEVMRMNLTQEVWNLLHEKNK